MIRLNADTNSRDLPKILIVTSSLNSLAHDYLFDCDRYQVQQISEGESVLKICETDLADCVLLDWESCNLEPAGFFEQLSQVSLPIIILVERTNEAAIVSLGQDYLIKQTLTQDFLEFAIQQAIAKTKLKHQLAEAEAKLKSYQQFSLDPIQKPQVSKLLHSIQHTLSKHYRKELRQNIQTEINLRTFLNNAPAIIYTKDLAGRYLEINQEFEQKLQTSAVQIRGKTDHHFLHSQTADLLRQNDHQAISAKSAIHVEETVELEDGLHTYIATKFPLLDNQGEPYALAGISIDISDRKAIENSLKIQNNILEQIAKGNRLSDIFDSLMLGVESQLTQALGSIVICDHVGEMSYLSAPNLPTEYVRLTDKVMCGEGVGSCGTAIARQQPVIVSDIANDPLWQNFKEVALSFDLRACWSIPIFSSDRQVLGSFGVYYQEIRSPQPEELAILIQAANIAGIALERELSTQSLQNLNATLEQRVEERTIALKASESFFELQSRCLGCLAIGDPLSQTLDLLLKLIELEIDFHFCSILGVNNTDKLVPLTTMPSACELMCESISIAGHELIFGKDWLNLIDIDFNPNWQNYLHLFSSEGIKSCWSIPIWGQSSENKLGIMNLFFCAARQPTEHEVKIIRFAAYVASIAIERNQTELALQESHRFTQRVADSSPNILYLYDLQQKQNIYANNGLFNILGYSPDQVSNMGTNLFPTLIYADDLAKVNAHFEQLSRAKDGEILEIEYRAINANGDMVCLLSRNTPFNRDHSGMVKQIIGTAQDISDRQKAEIELLESREQLRQSEELLLLTIENTPVGICTFDLEADFISANQEMCQIFGYCQDELLLKNMLLLTHPDFVKLTLSGISQLIAGTERNIRLEKQYLHKNNRIIDAISRVSLIKDPEGNPLHFVASVEDITEQKQIAIALMQRMERQQFLMNITQQIRQSLNLDQVLQTAVIEIKRLLNSDRAVIFQLFEDGTSKVVKEAVEPNFPAILDRNWLDQRFTTADFEYYINSNIRIVPDIFQDQRSICSLDFLIEAEVKSKIVVPIVHNINISNQNQQNLQNSCWRKDNSQLWGLLMVHSCEKIREWQPEEAELLQQLASQLAIAIQQADLFQQVQSELFARKQFEQELQIQADCDRLLSEVIGAINQSLDVEQTLDLILKKVQDFLNCDRIQIFQLDKNFDGYVIKEEVSRPNLAILGTMINDACFATTNVVQEYLDGKITVLSDVLNDPKLMPCYVDLLTKYNVRANLAAPIIQSNQLWGLLLVHQCDSPRVWLSAEINLVKQVAAQIGISAQKEKLYQRIFSELTQKKVLLKEIHHRVKNNLQVMSSLLRMQFRKSTPAVRVLAEEYQNRIQSMALIHDQLYRSDDLSHVDFDRYISNLTASLFQCYGVKSELIKLSLDLNDILLPLDQSIPLGLIINELLSNCLKYAFPQGFGLITIQLIKLEQHYQLSVSDNGIGIPADFDLQNTDGLGMQLVDSLTHQLEGELTYNGKNGSTFRITFPII